MSGWTTHTRGEPRERRARGTSVHVVHLAAAQLYGDLPPFWCVLVLIRRLVPTRALVLSNPGPKHTGLP